MSRDGWLLFGSRFLRLFAFGLVSVTLLLYLTELGMSPAQSGMLLTLTMFGDTLVSLLLTTRADRTGRRRTLIIGAALMVAGGILVAGTHSFAVLVLACTIAVISPSGGEVGPFLPVEQAALAQVVPAARRTAIFARYNLTGSFATALGAFAAGVSFSISESFQLTGAAAHRPTLLTYAALGLALAALATRLSPAVEVPAEQRNPASTEVRSVLGLHRSRGIVAGLACLFALDAFGGGFIMQSVLAYWLHLRFGLTPTELGTFFLAANLLAGISSLAAGWLAQRFGLINTMVFTHLPSNVLLMLVPLMPTVEWAIAVLLMRFSISQMDVPTRQAYVVSAVAPDERSAASGVTNVARSIGASLAPVLSTSLLVSTAHGSAPFFIAGGVKIVYDLLLWRAFASRSVES